MVDEKTRLQTIKNMVIRGMILHTEIKPRLNEIECGIINPDEIVKLSLKYKYGNSKTLGNRITNKIGIISEKIIVILLSLFSGIISAEINAAKIYSKTIIGEKLNGFGDNLLFWLGKKSIEVTGIEMINAVAKAFQSTPIILKWFFIGAIAGFIIWKICKKLIIFIYKRNKLNHDVKRILRIYSHHTSTKTHRQ